MASNMQDFADEFHRDLSSKKGLRLSWWRLSKGVGVISHKPETLLPLPASSLPRHLEH